MALTFESDAVLLNSMPHIRQKRCQNPIIGGGDPLTVLFAEQICRGHRKLLLKHKKKTNDQKMMREDERCTAVKTSSCTCYGVLAMVYLPFCTGIGLVYWPVVLQGNDNITMPSANSHRALARFVIIREDVETTQLLSSLLQPIGRSRSNL